MQIEYEATFLNIDKDEVRRKLKNAGAELIRPEFLQKRFAFNPAAMNTPYCWARVRDEGDKITMTYKESGRDKIEDQKEINLIVDDFDKAVEFLEAVGCHKKAFQESKREIWHLDKVEICLDEWPFLEPYVEVEGKSEEEVKKVSEKIGFGWNKARFCSVEAFYAEKYSLDPEIICNKTPKIVFNMENPFIKNEN